MKVFLFLIYSRTCSHPACKPTGQINCNIWAPWQRAGSTTEDRSDKRKAAPTTLLLELDEQLWSSHSLKLWDSGPKPRDLFQIGKSPEEEVSKADARKAHPEGACNRLRRVLFAKAVGAVLHSSVGLKGCRIEQKQTAGWRGRDGEPPPTPVNNWRWMMVPAA